mmetsp:Transcript_47584/g.123245  ORF Transcript_47584/g.123245 Transcript_47584/m.123245 type:complete len:232 (-) Transcript_47584:1057-1752(-)
MTFCKWNDDLFKNFPITYIVGVTLGALTMLSGIILIFACPVMYKDVTYYKRGIDDVRILSDTSVWFQYTLYDHTYSTFIIKTNQEQVNTYVNLAHTDAGYHTLWLRVQNHTLDTVYVHRWGTQAVYTGSLPDYNSTFLSNIPFFLFLLFPFFVMVLVLFLFGPFESMFWASKKEQTWIYYWFCICQVDDEKKEKAASSNTCTRKRAKVYRDDTSLRLVRTGSDVPETENLV